MRQPFILFFDKSYELSDEVLGDYPFATKNGMLLFGDYQFGGHRNFQEQLLFAPEDCSSAVGKALYLTSNEMKSFSTKTMDTNYGKYNCQPVTTLSGSAIDDQMRLMRSGDIYLYINKKAEGHIAFTATVPDLSSGTLPVLEYNRDIEATTDHKLLGGGERHYNLFDKARECTGDKELRIFRPTDAALKESSALPLFLRHIDERYKARFPNGPKK